MKAGAYIKVPPREGKSTSWLELTSACYPIYQLLAVFFFTTKKLVKHPKKQNLSHIVPVKRGRELLFDPWQFADRQFADVQFADRSVRRQDSSLTGQFNDKMFRRQDSLPTRYFADRSGLPTWNFAYRGVRQQVGSLTGQLTIRRKFCTTLKIKLNETLIRKWRVKIESTLNRESVYCRCTKIFLSQRSRLMSTKK